MIWVGTVLVCVNYMYIVCVNMCMNILYMYMYVYCVCITAGDVCAVELRCKGWTARVRVACLRVHE